MTSDKNAPYWEQDIAECLRVAAEIIGPNSYYLRAAEYIDELRTELKHRCVCRFTSGGNLKGELCAYHKRLRNDEAEGLRRDAERYRWLRDGDADTDMDDFPIVHGASTRNALFGEDLDSAIDAAKDAK